VQYFELIPPVVFFFCLAFGLTRKRGTAQRRLVVHKQSFLQQTALPFFFSVLSLARVFFLNCSTSPLLLLWIGSSFFVDVCSTEVLSGGDGSWEARDR
jgi:hypothetical protein